jgi:hypothetical protein
MSSPLLFHAYMATPILVTDLGILMQCGQVQQIADERGQHDAAGWWIAASESYPPCDDVNRLARAACLSVARGFRGGVQQ